MAPSLAYPRITISGARGIIGKDLTQENARAMALAYAVQVGGGKIVLGRDARRSGVQIREAVVEGLQAGGAEILDIGLAPTPTVGIMIRVLSARGGICITASHNPDEWNALKFFGPDGTFPAQAFVDEYIRILKDGSFLDAPPVEAPPLQMVDTALQTHTEMVLKTMDVDAVKQAGFKVVVDGCRSVGGLFLPPFLEQLGCEVIRLDCEPDGLFQRGLEPVPEHLGRLCEAVREHGADVGFAADPDADRLAIVSEEGRAIGEEFTLALAAWSALIDREGCVVTNLSTSMLTDYAAKMAGGKAIRTPIGEANVAAGIIEHKAVIGGEGNGGVMYPAVHNGRDALTAAGLVLNLMAREKATVAGLVSRFPGYTIMKDKVEIDLTEAHRRLAEIARMKHDGDIDDRDGVKLIGDDWWLHLRCSNTEPIVRIIAEAEGEGRTQNLMKMGRTLLMG
jgi:phosphomannomutase